MSTVAALRGMLIMGGGVILLMYTLGLLQAAFSAILIVFALCAIVYGYVSSGLYELTKGVLFKNQKK